MTAEKFVKENPMVARDTGVAELLKSHRRLLGAAKKVYAGLNVRIKAASPHAVPVFDGIAELHTAINKAEASHAE